MLQRLRQDRLRSPLVRLLLAAMVLRALVPVGFMPAASAGWPGLQICGPAALLLAGGDDLAASMDGRTTHPGTAHAACPFALSPAAASLPDLDAAVVFVPATTAAPRPATLSPPARTLIRAHRPRGPPSPA